MITNPVASVVAAEGDEKVVLGCGRQCFLFVPFLSFLRRKVS